MALDPKHPGVDDEASTLPRARQAPNAGARDRFDELTLSIASRLRRVCEHLSEEDFANLVHEIASVTLRYEEREFGTLINLSELPRRAD